jgi:murein DD-endopeptidase MepM/ murein hydrolase activator NlpD
MRAHASARDSQTRFVIQIAHRRFRRDFALRPALVYGLFGLLPLIGALYLGVSLYLMFRDDMLASLMRRQAQMQFAYEDRIAALRTQLDAASSRQLLNQDSFEGKVAELALRQAQLESRSALVASLTRNALAASAIDEPVGGALASRKSEPAAGVPIPPPRPAAEAAASDLKPAPQGFELRLDLPPDATIKPGEDVSDNSAPLSTDDRLSDLARSFDRIEQGQMSALYALRAPTAAKAQALRAAFDEAGLPLDRMLRRVNGLAARSGAGAGKDSAQGGPYEAMSSSRSSSFDLVFADIRQSVEAIDGLRRALPFAPLRQPLPGQLDITSTFGPRVDPFLGRAAMHTGMDFRGGYGATVRATASGRIAIAAAVGGYGNLVEIDHGAGLATRYGHLSEIDVEPGQWVEAGASIGQIGSTGRSTGPHLHYEVRVDGAAVDPSRYIRAGRFLDAAL